MSSNIVLVISIITAVKFSFLIAAYRLSVYLRRNDTDYRGDMRRCYREALDTIVAASLERESTTEFGESVFLSHKIIGGEFRHWVLHTHGHKYELRQVETDDLNSRGCYAAVIGLSSFARDAYDSSLTTSEVGQYFFSLIGWTTLSKEQVDENCHQVWETFGKYNLVSNNCHNFLEQFADKIVTTRASDWNWFRQLTLGRHHYVERGAVNYQVICAAKWIKLKQLEQMKHYSSTTEQRRIEDLIVKLEQFIYANLDHSITYRE